MQRTVTNKLHAASRLRSGAPAPGFTLPDSAGRPIALSDYRGKNVIIYFYPRAATPGCTAEACDFRDSFAALQGAGFEVLGISPDAREDLAAFAAEHALTFPLLADQDHATALAYGAWGEKLVDGEVHEGTLRSTVVVGQDGNVVLTQYRVSAEGHVRALREELGV